MTVQLGYVGLALTLIPFLIVLIEVARWALRAPSPESCFFFGFLVYTAIRTYVEVDLFGQYALAFVIFIASYVCARRDKRRRARPRAQRQATSQRLALRGA